ncbi:uncharacterized protein LOC121882503 isoform X1 [Scomber scombrus]|uniref:Uncharacterized protein LOC121882503 isoform X1 n=3 Tax=Scomber scombrus TaxID=13677 RepID=A0AAV1QHT7_SCOSC
MPETPQRNYRTIDMADERVAASWRRFFVVESGKTNGAHSDLVRMIKGIGHSQVSRPEDCDYLLIICPAVSRVGTNISEALESLPAGKPAILVVMHHTFNKNAIVAESRRQVTNQNIYLTVDVFFYEKNLLNCNRNDIAWCEIQKFLVGSQVQFPGRNLLNRIRSMGGCSDRACLIIASLVALAGIVTAITVAVIHFQKKN